MQWGMRCLGRSGLLVGWMRAAEEATGSGIQYHPMYADPWTDCILRQVELWDRCIEARGPGLTPPFLRIVESYVILNRSKLMIGERWKGRSSSRGRRDERRQRG